ncbi:alpha/beta fold hydrolase [Fibrella arboris]|uniref:alpha/beta fold hydrolase n=1 Tax=Fibrella arboris TaxID=3242486 RepID=UPI003521A15B
MKTSCMFFLLLVCSLSVCGQATPYGNNAAAGKYQLVNGVRLYYETYGKGEPLLLIHGNGGSISSFSKNIPYFARNYRVIAVDSRAHGKSVDPGDSLSFEMMADDFAALLTALKVNSAYVIGWSDGGINALLLAMRHPEKVKKLVATGANLWPDSTALVPSLWNQMQKEYVEKKAKLRTSPKEKNDWKVFVLDVLQPNIPLQALQAIKSPSLIMAGDRDLIVTAHTVAIAQNVPNSWLWIVPHCGHATLIDRADEFNTKVSEFFRFK